MSETVLTETLRLFDAATPARPPRGWRWGSTYALVRAAGEDFTGRALPRGRRYGPPRHCYANAARLALRAGAALTYCEGYVLVAGLLPVHHAWCVDAAGGVVDPTLRCAAGWAYRGVRVPTRLLAAAAAYTGHPGAVLGDHCHGFPWERFFAPESWESLEKFYGSDSSSG